MEDRNRHRTDSQPTLLPDDQEAAAGIVSGAITAVTLGIAFSLLALGVESFWLSFPIGFGVVLPIAVSLVARGRSDSGARSDRTREADQQTPLEELRLRYARGELTEAEFERRVERLLETDQRTAPLSR